MEFTSKNILFILVLLGSISFLYFSLFRLYYIVKLGKREKSNKTLWQNIKRLLKIAIGQTKIFRDKDRAGYMLQFSGIFSLLIFSI